MIIPTHIEFTLDPLELNNRGQVYSDSYWIENHGSSDVLLTFTEFNIIFANDTDFKPQNVPHDGMYISDEKSIFLTLNFDGIDIPSVVLTDSEVSTGASIPLYSPISLTNFLPEVTSMTIPVSSLPEPVDISSVDPSHNETINTTIPVSSLPEPVNISSTTPIHNETKNTTDTTIPQNTLPDPAPISSSTSSSAISVAQPSLLPTEKLSAFSFNLSGSLNEYSNKTWLDGDVSVSISYSIEILPSNKSSMKDIASPPIVSNGKDDPTNPSTVVPDFPSDQNPTDSPSGQTPPDPPSDLTPPDTPSDLTPPDPPSDLTPPDH